MKMTKKSSCTAKNKYEKEELAEKAALEATARIPWHPRLYTYRCPYCGGFHITKMPQKKKRA